MYEATGCARQHHAHKIVAGEHKRLLDGAGRDGDLACAHPDEHVAVFDRHEVALVDANGASGTQHFDTHITGLLRERASRLQAGLRQEQRAAGLRSIVD